MADYAIHDTTLEAIADVIRKKEGSSALIDPAEYAERINLMGMLEKKIIVSSPICDFTDGSDDVPTDFVKIFIPANLDGKSSVSEVQSGRNLLDTAIAETKTHNSVSITCDGNGKYTATGTATGGSANVTFTLKTPCTIKSGMYLHLMNSGANGSVSITLQKQDNTTIYAPALSPANRIADLSSYAGQTIYSIRFYIANGASFEMSLTPMICFSNTATTYEPYIEPKTYSANLGRTISGGEADIVNGEAKPVNLAYDEESHLYPRGNLTAVINNNTWTAYAKVKKNTTYYVSAIGSTINRHMCYGFDDEPNTGDLSTALTVTQVTADSVYKFNSGNYEYIGFYYSNVSASQIVISETQETVYSPYFEPFTFDGQEVPTRLGYNAFWSDDGDTSVAYRASGTIYQYPRGEEASF